MLHTLTLPDGTVIGSGRPGAAVRTVRVTSSVGDTPAPGGVCAAELEVTLFDDGISIQAGDRLRLADETGDLGIFIAQKPTRPAAGQLRVLAYDPTVLLDGSADGFLQATQFPIALGDFARELCAHFGLTLRGELLNGEHPVPAFHGQGLSGRQLLQWACQAGGRFCRANARGELELGWFRPTDYTLGATGAWFYYQDGLSLADYAVPPVGQVVLRQNATDQGVCYPAEGSNALYIDGNPLLTGQTEGVAQSLQEALCDFTFTPCTVTTNAPLTPGDLFTVIWQGCAYTCAAMTVERSGGRFRVTGTGTASRDTPSYRGSYRAMNGRVLNLAMELSGVKSQLAELGSEGARLSQLEQDVDHITAQVALLDTADTALNTTLESLEQATARQFASLSLRSDAMEVTVGAVAGSLAQKADAATVAPLTEHFRFDENGLTISDSATGMGIGVSEDRVVFTGGQPTTWIDPNGIGTTDLTVENRLSLGDFALLPRTNGNLSLRWLGT